jgi:hypothetical protein
MLIGIFIFSDETIVKIQSPTDLQLIRFGTETPITGVSKNGTVQMPLDIGVYKIVTSVKLDVQGADVIAVDGKDDRPDPTLKSKAVASIPGVTEQALDAFFIIPGSRSFP